MFGRNFEDLIKVSKEPRGFDEDFFDFTDKLHPWTTVYRFFFLADIANKTQFMLGVGQKKADHYWVNNEKIVFSDNHPMHKVGVSYWLENGSLTHNTLNDEITVTAGRDIISSSFSFEKADSGYSFSIDDVNTTVLLDDHHSKTDYVGFNAVVHPFYRHNKYLSFTGTIMGEEVSKGVAFIQKVYLNMPFIPWRWGRAFFEGGAQLDFYEPRFMVPLYRSINLEVDDRKFEFKHRTRIMHSGDVWTVSGQTSEGERLEARIKSYSKVPQTFRTPRSTFAYTEMPSQIEDLKVKKKGQLLFSNETLGESVANCEDAYYKKMLPCF